MQPTPNKHYSYLLTGGTTIILKLARSTLEGVTCAAAYTATMPDIIPSHLLLRNLGNCLGPLLCGQYLALAVRVAADREHYVYNSAMATQRPILDHCDRLVTYSSVRFMRRNRMNIKRI